MSARIGLRGCEGSPNPHTEFSPEEFFKNGTWLRSGVVGCLLVCWDQAFRQGGKRPTQRISIAAIIILIRTVDYWIAMESSRHGGPKPIPEALQEQFAIPRPT